MPPPSNKLKPWLHRALALLLIYLALAALLATFQSTFIFFPTPSTPHLHQDLFIDHPTNRTHLIKISPKNPSTKAILYFGGNAENVTLNARPFSQHFPNHTLYLFHYPGYGKSTGQPSQDLIFSCALEVFDTLSPQHSSISLIGRSLGTGVATHLAKHRPTPSLVLITPYDSIQSLAQSQFPLFPISLLLQHPFPSIENAPHIQTPTLILLAQYDQVIPFPHSQRLHQAFPPNVSQLHTLPNTSHNSISNHQTYHPLISNSIQNPHQKLSP